MDELLNAEFKEAFDEFDKVVAFFISLSGSLGIAFASLFNVISKSVFLQCIDRGGSAKC